MSADPGTSYVEGIAFGVALSPDDVPTTGFLAVEYTWIFWLSFTTAAAFIGFACPRICHLLYRRRPNNPHRPISVLAWKLLLGITFAGLRLAILVEVTRRGRAGTWRLTASRALDVTAACLVVALSAIGHFKSVRPSTLVCGFLLLLFIYDTARCPLLWEVGRQSEPRVPASLFTASIPITLALLVLENGWPQPRQAAGDASAHSPEESSGILSLALYAWLDPLIWRGYRSTLSMSSLYPLDNAISVKELPEESLENRRRDTASCKNQPRASTWCHVFWIFKHLGNHLLLPVLPRLCLLGFTLCQPFLVQRLLTFLSADAHDETSSTASGLISVTIFIYLGLSISTALYWYYQERFQSVLRAFLISSIYHKAIHISPADEDAGAAVTLMGADVERIYTGLRGLHEIWANAIQIAFSLWFLYRQLGTAFAAPLVIVALGFSFSFLISTRAIPYQAAWMASIQARTSATSAIISRVKDLRISGMTTPAAVYLKQKRKDEIKVGQRSRTLVAISASSSQVPQAIAPACAFAFGPHSLDQTRAYTSLLLLALLTSPLLLVLQTVPIIAASLSCLRRIRLYLDRDEMVDARQFWNPGDPGEKAYFLENGTAIRLENASLGWKADQAVLRQLNLAIPEGRITFVTGPVASGKSTLCQAILGELPHMQGSIWLKSDRLAYCSQNPFLFNTSIRENILGFSPFNPDRYAEVVQAAMLVEDLRSLPRGDGTIVGSKGTALSGGQRQRVSLARALYHTADVLVLDDVFSGLDEATQGQVADAVFGVDGLLRRRQSTAVVSTHATHLLPLADNVIDLSDKGSVSLRDLGPRTEHRHNSPLKTAKEDDEAGRDLITSASVARPEATSAHSKPLPQAAGEEMKPPQGETKPAVPDIQVYRYWITSLGILPLLLYCILIVASGFFTNFPTIWVKFWSADSAQATGPKHSFGYWIGMYAFFGAATIICVFSAGLIVLRIGVRKTGTNLHDMIVDTVMRSSLRALTTTDVSKTMNLFSQDMNILDTMLPRMINNLSFTLSNAVGQAVIVCLSSGWLALSYPFFIAILWTVQHVYLPNSKRLRILDLEAKTPLYLNFTDTITGLQTIRAFGWCANQVARNNAYLDDSQRPSYLLAMVQQWLMLRINLVVTLLALILVALATQLRAEAGNVGAGLVTLISLSATLTTILVAYTGLETSLGAVTRLKTFSRDTEQECQTGGEGEGEAAVFPDESWPSSGDVQIRNVNATYNSTGEDSSKVLTDFSISIKPKQKVAICGRTGSGKSSIIALLLRLIEPLPAAAADSGNDAKAKAPSILIDGVALHTVDPVVLRERVIAESQDSVFLPEAGLRASLDPWGRASAAECTRVLQDIGMDVDLINAADTRGGIGEEDGQLKPSSELSHGQRQLLCVARAALRRRTRLRDTGADAGLLLLDEITSGADARTEHAIGRLLAAEFAGYTAVVVTHRLATAMACDRVVVLDAGRIVEDGPPAILWADEASRFRRLWGKATRCVRERERE